MSGLAPIAVVVGDTAAARVVAGAVGSLLTAVGRWVVETPASADLSGYAAVILTRSHGWRAVRATYAGPLLVIDADVLSGRADAAFSHLLGATPVASLMVGDARVHLPRPLPPLTGKMIGEVAGGLVAEAGAHLAYALPFMVTPGMRTVRGFWSLARALELALAGLIGADSFVYAEPWPRGFRSARALTYDLDGLESIAAVPTVVAGGRAATAFCCADALEHLEGARGLEVAAHGDVHRQFADARTNLSRVDRMLAAFLAAGLEPRGFSPPNLTYTSDTGPLLERFAYVRLGYQEHSLSFFPGTFARGTLTSVSYYPDFLHRYVGPEEYARLLGRFCRWAEMTGVLAVPCFHPCLWSEPLRRYLDAPPGNAWEATMAEVVGWWRHRERVLAAVACGKENTVPDVVLVESPPARRLAALAAVDAEPELTSPARRVARVDVAGREVRVVPAVAAPVAGVDIPLGQTWKALGWLPGPVRRAASRALVSVANKNGVHACLYKTLGLTPEIVGGALRLPLVAADEPLMLIRPALELRGIARRAVGRLAAARRSGRVPAHA